MLALLPVRKRFDTLRACSADAHTAYWFDYGMNFVGGSLAWRLPIACQVIFAFIVTMSQKSPPFAPAIKLILCINRIVE